jgi:hypothetical protein
MLFNFYNLCLFYFGFSVQAIISPENKDYFLLFLPHIFPLVIFFLFYVLANLILHRSDKYWVSCSHSKFQRKSSSILPFSKILEALKKWYFLCKHEALSSNPLTPKKDILSQAWWCIPAIPALVRMTWEDHELEASVGYIVRSYFNLDR